MKTYELMDGTPPVSRIGIGGHYFAMEEGAFEDRYALTDTAVKARAPLIERALAAGVTWFDTTWRNEAAVLAEILKATGLRDRVWVNGMVLGAFSGSKTHGVSVEEYFNRWLDARLKIMPGARFDTFMVNAVEEQYDPALCERLVNLLEKRRQAGDFRLLGFSSHDVRLAREVAGRFPEFRVIMIPYNFRNRQLEQHFSDYEGKAALIAMKCLVWAEYGVPFCAVNRLPRFAELFGFEPVKDIATRALRFVLRNPQPRTLVCAINTRRELEELLPAPDSAHHTDDARPLENYDRLQTRDDGVPVFLGALMTDNLRQNYFGVTHLARALGKALPELPLNVPDSPARIRAVAQRLLALLPESRFARYAGLVPPDIIGNPQAETEI
ncbi:MAG: aldo/keto reductase [Candidatus Sumerlaeota bacterium]|nr:aldo/keto reductase [Candidatus Sumerlaeota bacterium]